MAWDIAGKMVVVTGASSGIGAEAAVELASRGARVVAVGRDPERLARAVERISAAGGGGAVDSATADFASLSQVRRLAAELLERCERIDVLVNNAGLVSGRRTLTEDGHETTFAVNHLAPFLLTNLLLDRLKASAPARVVTTSSEAHGSGRIDFDDLDGDRRWSSWRAYCNSKLANILFTRALARRVPDHDLAVNCLHPGVVRTRLGYGGSGLLSAGWVLGRPFFASARRGASTIVDLASTPAGGDVSGLYFADSRPAPMSPAATDDEAGERLWAVSEELTGLLRGGA